MIGSLDEYDGEQQTTSELPEKPLKEWRRKFEASNLVSSNLMQYFQAASPFFFTIDQTAEYSDLGKFTHSTTLIILLVVARCRKNGAQFSSKRFAGSLLLRHASE